MRQPKIFIGEAQPVPCDTCGFSGYSYSDYMSVHYTSHHEPDGKYWGGEYSDGCKMINKSVTCFCSNCGNKLNFKLIRKDFETVR